MIHRSRSPFRCLASVVLVGLLFSSCAQRISQIVIKDSPTAVGSDWIDIPLPTAVVANWDAQVLEVSLSTKFEESTDPWGIKLEDGSIVIPEFALTTDGGSNYVLHLEGFANSNIVEIHFGNDSIPRGSHFARLRARSARPIMLSRVKWISYMSQDLKAGVR
jgi:hypothetical protein